MNTCEADDIKFYKKIVQIIHSTQTIHKYNHWYNLKTVYVSNYEKDITWRLWHNAWLNTKLAMKFKICQNNVCKICTLPHETSLSVLNCHSWAEVNAVQRWTEF